MKVIFLDIDGVLNFDGTEARAPCGCCGIADKKVSLLHKIIEATGAKVVLTSSWKDEWEKDFDASSPTGQYLERKMNRHGIHVLDKTTDVTPYRRGEGIHNWLLKNTHVTDWVVLDDEQFPDYGDYDIPSRLVRTTNRDGLTEKDVQNAIKILNETSRNER